MPVLNVINESQQCPGCRGFYAPVMKACPTCHHPNPNEDPMPTTIKKKRGARTGAQLIASGREHLNNGKASKTGTPARPDAEGELVPLAPSAIVASSFNPRHDFDEAKLRELAASLKKHGLLQPVVVRAPLDGKHELIIGERRWRASKLARLATIPARVLDVTDEEAIELAGIENLQREDLNAMEEAHWYRTMLDRCGFTQESLAKHLSARGFKDIDQSTISKRVRLLDLPEQWQARIRTGKLQPAAARELLPWLDTPKVLELLDRRLTTAEKSGYPIDSVRSFSNEVQGAARDASKPLDTWNCKFVPTKKRKAELDVRKVGHQQRAFNTKRWNELQQEAQKKQRQKAARATVEHTANGTKKTRKATAPPKPQFNGGECERLLQQFFEHTLAEHVDHIELPLLTRLALLVSSIEYDGIDPGDWTKIGMGAQTASLVKPILSATDEQLAGKLRTFLKAALEREISPRFEVSWGPSDWRDVAKYLALDPLAGWEPTTEFLELFPLADLKEIAGRAPQYFEEMAEQLDTIDKPSLIAWLIDHWPGGVPDPIRNVWES